MLYCGYYSNMKHFYFKLKSLKSGKYVHFAGNLLVSTFMRVDWGSATEIKTGGVLCFLLYLEVAKQISTSVLV